MTPSVIYVYKYMYALFYDGIIGIVYRFDISR